MVRGKTNNTFQLKKNAFTKIKNYLFQNQKKLYKSEIKGWGRGRG